MVAEFGVGLSAIKTALDIAKGMLDMKNEAEINSAVIDIQRQLLEANAAYSALTSRIRELEEESMRMKNWEGEKQRYQLTELPPGIFAYVIKPGMEGAEPVHHICANCYNKNVKSLLHNLGSSNGLTRWKCHECGFDEQSGKSTPLRRNRSHGSWMSE